jgi:hypothetical protein
MNQVVLIFFRQDLTPLNRLTDRRRADVQSPRQACHADAKLSHCPIAQLAARFDDPAVFTARPDHFNRHIHYFATCLATCSISIGNGFEISALNGGGAGCNK